MKPLDQLSSLACRAFFVIAFALLALAALQWLANRGGTALMWPWYEAGRLLEFSAIFMIFVVAILLRQIRDGLKTGP